MSVVADDTVRCSRQHEPTYAAPSCAVAPQAKEDRHVQANRHRRGLAAALIAGHAHAKDLLFVTLEDDQVNAAYTIKQPAITIVVEFFWPV
jgi:hypothetical protein